MKTVFVSGADGFVGRHICCQLASAGYSIRAGMRSVGNLERFRAGEFKLEKAVELGDIGNRVIQPNALLGCDAVIHLAARVHVMNETALNPLAAFRDVNVEGTRRLAQASVIAGVRRFIYVSSIKVNGETTFGEVFSESSEPKPRDPYAVSKREAEELLIETATSTGLEVTIVRPPLVYGPGVRGNLRRLIQHLYRRLPVVLPPGENKRSLISVYNLANLLTECIGNLKARNQIFLVSDGRDLSTRELINILAAELRRKAVVITLPKFVIGLGSVVEPVKKRLERLGGSLQIDSSKVRQLLDWTPPVSPELGLGYTARWFASQQN
jgi:nucleoside-diphosphate-sugar epimerase